MILFYFQDIEFCSSVNFRAVLTSYILQLILSNSSYNKNYVEIMKLLSQEQKLFMIIASTDYIYGTNYQFCHGYLGKDLQHLTQEKIIQALGRVGRNKQNKDYSMRMRDNDFIKKIFTPLDVKKEAETMNRLFTSE